MGVKVQDLKVHISLGYNLPGHMFPLQSFLLARTEKNGIHKRAKRLREGGGQQEIFMGGTLSASDKDHIRLVKTII